MLCSGRSIPIVPIYRTSRGAIGAQERINSNSTVPPLHQNIFAKTSVACSGKLSEFGSPVMGMENPILGELVMGNPYYSNRSRRLGQLRFLPGGSSIPYSVSLFPLPSPLFPL